MCNGAESQTGASSKAVLVNFLVLCVDRYTASPKLGEGGVGGKGRAASVMYQKRLIKACFCCKLNVFPLMERCE